MSPPDHAASPDRDGHRDRDAGAARLRGWLEHRNAHGFGYSH